MTLLLRRASLSVRRATTTVPHRTAWFGQANASDDPRGEAWRLHKTNEPVRTAPSQRFAYAARHIDLNPEIKFQFDERPAAPAPPSWPVTRPTPAPGPGFYSLVTATKAARS